MSSVYRLWHIATFRCVSEIGCYRDIADIAQAAAESPTDWRSFANKTLPKVATEISVLAYNLTRIMNVVGIKPLIAAIAA
jgi:hypothetical protein